jgi:hypothetical protein
MSTQNKVLDKVRVDLKKKLDSYDFAMGAGKHVCELFNIAQK